MKTAERKQALVAGISIIIMAIAAIFAYGYVFPLVEVEGDPVNTWEQMVSNRNLFIAGLGAWVIIFITDLLVTVALFFFFRKTRNNLALATAAARLFYTIILGIALSGLFGLVPHLNETGVDATQAGTQVLGAFESFRKYYTVGLIIFGVHLLGLGYLCILNARVPNLFAYLLLVAGLGYLVVDISRMLPVIPVATVDTMESILMVPMALGEILLAIWLIVKGGKL